MMRARGKEAFLALVILGCSATAASASVDWRAPVEFFEETAAVRPAAPISGAKTETRPPFFNIAALQLRQSFYYPEISGNVLRASKIPRLYREQNWSMRTAKSWGDGYLWTSAFGFRMTDDPQTAPTKNHKWQLLSLVSSLAYKEKWDINFGNVLPNYHRYAVSASMEGLTANYKWVLESKDRFEISAGAGRTSRGLDASRYTRWLNAATAAWTSRPDPWGPLELVSLRWAGSSLHDDPSSIDNQNAPARVNDHATALRLDSKWKGGYAFDADWGFSQGQQDVRGGRIQNGGAFATNLAYRKPFSTETVKGWRRVLPVSWRGSYEIVDQDYFAPQASAGADQLRWGLQADHPFFDWFGYNWSLNRQADNARKLRPVTSFSLNEAHTLTISPFRAPAMQKWFNLAEDEMKVAAEDIERRAGDTTVIVDTTPPNPWKELEVENLRLNLGFRRTSRNKTDWSVISKTEDYSFGASSRIGKWSYGGQYAWQLVDDDRNSVNDRRTINWSLTTGRSWEVGQTGIVMQANGGFRKSADALLNNSQSNHTEGGNAGLSGTWRDWSAGLDWTTSRTVRNVLGSGSHVQSARLNLGYRPPKIPSLDMKLSGNLQDNKEDNDHNNFITRDVRLDLTYDF